MSREVIAICIADQQGLTHHVILPVVEIFLFLHRAPKETTYTIREVAVVQTHLIIGKHFP